MSHEEDGCVRIIPESVLLGTNLNIQCIQLMTEEGEIDPTSDLSFPLIHVDRFTKSLLIMIRI